MIDSSWSVEIVKRVLIKAGLFKESDLELFHLRGSGIESLLFASYGGMRSFYLYEKGRILIPPREEDVLSCPPVFLRIAKWEEFSPSSKPEGLSYLFSREEPFDVIIEQDKYIYLAGLRSIGPTEIKELYRESLRLGIDPLNVMVVEVNINPKVKSPFDEYLAGVVLRNQRYLVTRFSFWGFGPDLYAYRASTFGDGAFLLEIGIGAKKLRKGLSEETVALIEAEAQARILEKDYGINLVDKYLNESEGYFGKGFISASLAADYQIEGVTLHGFGIITFDEEGNIIFKDSKDFSIKERQSEMLTLIKGWERILEERAKKCFLMKKPSLY
ncbi:MAG: hypothetical protein ACXQTI_04685 [Candidatus Nezhaarchaeales archaeon]